MLKVDPRNHHDGPKKLKARIRRIEGAGPFRRPASSETAIRGNSIPLDGISGGFSVKRNAMSSSPTCNRVAATFLRKCGATFVGPVAFEDHPTRAHLQAPRNMDITATLTGIVSKGMMMISFELQAVSSKDDRGC